MHGTQVVNPAHTSAPPTHHHPQRRADQLEVVRRVPLPGYDLTFLVTSAHMARFHRDLLIDFICQVRGGV